MFMKLLHEVKIAETNSILVLIVPSKNYKCLLCMKYYIYVNYRKYWANICKPLLKNYNHFNYWYPKTSSINSSRLNKYVTNIAFKNASNNEMTIEKAVTKNTNIKFLNLANLTAKNK